ncbi:MAG: hypothetical protein EBX41_06835 [Chitinophagia bacterium]|nr:hypothetical protein [Chitinophagia bacterium]
MASSPQKKPNKPQAAKPTPAPENTPAENTGIKRHILDITDAEPFWNVWNADIFKKAFYISLAAMLLMLWISGYNVGYHQDEMDMNAYGKANIAYYMSGGKDTTYLGCENCYGNYHVDKLLRYYGSAYEYMPVLINKITGLDKTKEEFNVRHLIAQLCSIICLLFCGLIAKRFAGWRAAIITIWMLFCSPVFFGHSLFNSKDIPFCTGYVATLYYILVFIDELPSPTWRTSIYMMLAFAFTMGTRVGGLLLFGYLGIFSLLIGKLNNDRIKLNSVVLLISSYTPNLFAVANRLENSIF